MTLYGSTRKKNSSPALVPATWSKILLFLIITALAASAATQSTSSTTTLSVSPASAAAGSVFTLTATVSSDGNPVSSGLVLFCNTSAAHCIDSGVLGAVWVTRSGIATLRRTFPAGTTNVQAVFQGTSTRTNTDPNTYSSSSSSAQAVTVTSQTTTPTSAVTFPTLGAYAAGVVSADFNNDGYPDLAVTDESGTVQIFLGNGDGTFTAGKSYSLYTGGDTGEPLSIDTADFNGDGNADLVVAGYYILLGKGDGTFTVSTTSTTPTGSIVKVADFNGDGYPDLAIYSGDSAFLIMLGNGDGTFQNGLSSSSIGASENFVVADFNGDGIQDIAVCGGFGLGVQVLLGKGTGTFTPTTAALTSGNPKWVAVGDFNGDGVPDLAVTDPVNQTVTVLTAGYVNGTFTLTPNSQQSTLSSPTLGEPFAAGVTGSGNTDLMVVLKRSASTDPTFWLLPGNGNGTFGSGTTFSITPPDAFSAGGIAFGDFFSNGATSAAVLTGQSPSYVTVLQDTSAGITPVKTLPVITWATPAAIQSPTPLSSTQLNATANVAGTFTYNPPSGTVLSSGQQVLTATFTPTDTVHYSTAEGIVTLTVNPPTGSYTISASPTSQTFTNTINTPPTYTLSLSSLNNYTGNVSFTTSVSASQNNPNVTVTASVPRVSLTSGGTATTTLTVVVQTSRAANHRPQLPWRSGLVSMCGVVLLGAPFAARRKRLLAVLLSAVVLTLAGFLTSCGSGLSVSGGGNPTTYTITVTPTGTGQVSNPSPVSVTLTLN
jgi:hypothetical protein